MSLDIRQLELAIAGGEPEKKRQAEKILPIRRQGNLLLCTLLLGNTAVNAMLALFMEEVAGGFLAGPIRVFAVRLQQVA